MAIRIYKIWWNNVLLFAYIVTRICWTKQVLEFSSIQTEVLKRNRANWNWGTKLSQLWKVEIKVNDYSVYDVITKDVIKIEMSIQRLYEVVWAQA